MSTKRQSMSLLRHSFVRFNRKPCQIQGLKRYHSYEHPSPPPYSSTAQSILSAAISHIPQHGFTQKTLHLGAKDSGFMSISTNLFPRGVFDLIAFYLMTRRLALQDTVNGENGYAKSWYENKTGVGSRVRTLLLERLKMNEKAGIISRWPEVSNSFLAFSLRIQLFFMLACNTILMPSRYLGLGCHGSANIHSSVH